MSSARLAAIVDFPSCGSDDVKPMTVQASRLRLAMELALAAPYKGLPSLLTTSLPGPAAPSIVTLMERSASAKRENGELSAVQIRSWSRTMVLELEPSSNP